MRAVCPSLAWEESSGAIIWMVPEGMGWNLKLAIAAGVVRQKGHA